MAEEQTTHAQSAAAETAAAEPGAPRTDTEAAAPAGTEPEAAAPAETETEAAAPAETETEAAAPAETETEAAAPAGTDVPPASPAGAAREPDAGEAREAEEAVQDDAAKFLALAQRTQADFENYRKRMARENASAVDRGVGKLAKELLPALDHLEIALKASESHAGSDSSTGTSEDVIKGFALVRDEIVNALSRVGIQPFAPQGEAFDPNEHEAMASQPAEGAEPGTVIEVYQQGYRINGAVLRPARVVVAA